MARDEKLRVRWKELHKKISDQFADGELMELDAILYLIGVQELNQLNVKFDKDDKVNLMHIAICRLLEPLGFYEFDFFDEEGWPHFKLVENIPTLRPGEQSIMMKEAVVNYFLENGYIS